MPKRQNRPGMGRGGQFGGRGARGGVAMMQGLLRGMIRSIGMRGFGRGMGRGGFRGGRGRGGPPGGHMQDGGDQEPGQI